MVLSGVGCGSSVGLVAVWSSGGVVWCGSLSHGDGSIDGSFIMVDGFVDGFRV